MDLLADLAGLILAALLGFALSAGMIIAVERLLRGRRIPRDG